MHVSIKVDVRHFQEYGYALIKQVFTKEEVHEIRCACEGVKSRSLAQQQQAPGQNKAILILGDLLTHIELRPFDYLVFDQRIISCARQIVGPQLVYFGDSSVQTGEGTRGFHKDNVDRLDPAGADWQGEYPLVRCGIYLQDHSRYSGGLKLRERSHMYPGFYKGASINVPSEAGDVVFWNLRTTHSGNNVRLRWLPKVSVYPRLETLTPQWLRLPEELERFAAFITFGAPGDHLDRYIANMVRRGDYHDYLRLAGVGHEIDTLAASRGVELRHPIPDYGSKYQPTTVR